jgi:Tol biopolymer transport system component
VALAGERKAELFLDGRTLVHPAFSPDGHWVAYVYVESMHSNIYVQPFPKTSAARYQITQKGRNDAPLWSPDGKELFFYNSESQKLMAVSIQTQPAFSFGQPVPLPIEGITQNGGGRRYDITPDGKRFLVMLPDTSTKGKSRHTQQVNVVLNWFEELKKIQGKQ